jgi:hypothetical protein
MATRGDVVQERRRYRWIRRVLGWIFFLSTIGWIGFYLYGIYALHNEYGLWRTFQIWTMGLGFGLFSDSWTTGAGGRELLHQFRYLFYASFVSGIVLYYYLRHLASFKCPYCRKVVEVDMTWQCAACNHVRTRPLWYTIFHKCKWRKCKERPDGVDCPHCGSTIYLLSPAPPLRTLPPGEPQTGGVSNVAHFPGTRP